MAGKGPQSEQEIRHPRQRDMSPAKVQAMVSRSALQLKVPFSIVADQFVEVRTENLASFFTTIRHSLIQDAARGKPTALRNADSIISKEQFILVCRHLTASRVSRVFNIFCGRDEGPSLIPPDFPVPDVILDKVNGIGIVTVQEGAYRICPRPEPDLVHSDPEEFESTLVQFTSLVDAASAHGGSVTTSTLANSIEGSSWWLLTARSTREYNSRHDRNTAVDNDFDDVIILGAHKDWTYIDALYCAAIRNRFSGLLPVENTLKWSIGEIKTRGYKVDMTGPKPTASEQYVQVFSENMVPYFAAVRRSLLETVELHSSDRASTISEPDFIRVCRHLTAWRAKRIHTAQNTGIRWTDLPQVPSIELPLGLCTILNGIGAVRVHGGQMKICPKPEDYNRDIFDKLPSSLMSQFNHLVQAAKKRRIISTAPLSSTITGSSWWLLTARSPANQEVVAWQSDEVTVYGSHKEWTVRDAFHCAIVQNKFDGILPIENTLKWSIGTLQGVPALRNLHFLPYDVRQTRSIM